MRNCLLSGTCGIAGRRDRSRGLFVRPGLRRATYRAEWWPDSRHRSRNSWDASTRSATSRKGYSAGNSARPEIRAPSYRSCGVRLLIRPASMQPPSSSSTASARRPARRCCGPKGRASRRSRTLSYPALAGILWEHASIHLGFSPYDAAKVMGLAAYGDPDVLSGGNWHAIIQVSEDGYQVDARGARLSLVRTPRELETLFGAGAEAPTRKFYPGPCTIAAALQAATDAAVAGAVAAARALRRAREPVPGRRRALNCVTNA